MPLDALDRQVAFRARMAELGLSRREVWLTGQAVEDEAYVRAKLGPERVRVLVAWVLAQERKKLEGGG